MTAGIDQRLRKEKDMTMLIERITQASVINSAASPPDKAVALNDRVAALNISSTESGVPVTQEDGPSTDPTLEYDLEEVYQWMLANQSALIDDPRAMVKGTISKLKALTRSDGTPTYKSYQELTAACAMIQKRCKDTGVESGDFFTQLNGTLFGMSLFINQFINQIFFTENNTGTPKSYF